MERFLPSLILALAFVLSPACDDASAPDPAPDAPSPSPRMEGPPLHQVELPPGFEIDLYATGLPGARSLKLSPSGTLFVGSRREGNVYAVIDEDQDQKADRVQIIFEEGDQPNGLAFRDGSL